MIIIHFLCIRLKRSFYKKCRRPNEIKNVSNTFLFSNLFIYFIFTRKIFTKINNKEKKDKMVVDFDKNCFIFKFIYHYFLIRLKNSIYQQQKSGNKK